jgi:thymidylate synthase (FAD)
MVKTIIKDPYFNVSLDLDASSPNPAKAIWKAQHVCVAEEISRFDPLPVNPSQAIIKNQLKVKHWSVLKFAFVKLDFTGFPHDTVMQMARHSSSSILVQSMRYTGARMMGCDLEDVEKLFYIPPTGKYPSRDGTWEMTEQMRKANLKACWRSADNYAVLVKGGQQEESARRILCSGYRQNFTLAGTLQATFHWLHQRTLADSQLECQTLAWMALDELERWEPQLMHWFRENLAGKNTLSP